MKAAQSCNHVLREAEDSPWGWEEVRDGFLFRKTLKSFWFWKKRPRAHTHRERLQHGAKLPICEKGGLPWVVSLKNGSRFGVWGRVVEGPSITAEVRSQRNKGVCHPILSLLCGEIPLITVKPYTKLSLPCNQSQWQGRLSETGLSPRLRQSQRGYSLLSKEEGVLESRA